MKLSEWRVNFRWLLFASFGLISIPSAYLFGLTVPLGGGMAIFLDLTFYSTEVFKFLLFVAGVSAFLRPILLLLFASFAAGEVTVDDALDSNSWRLVKTLFKAVLLVFLSLLLLAPMTFGVQLTLSFLITISIPVMICLVFYSTFSKVPLRTFKDVVSYVKRSVDLKQFSTQPLLLLTNVTMAMVVALAGGYYRTVSLAVDDTFCVLTGKGIIQAAPVARTDLGVIFAQNVEDRWLPFAFPTAIAIVQSDVFVFVYNNEIQAVSMKCDAFPKAYLG